MQHRGCKKEFTNFRATSSGLVVHFFNVIIKTDNGHKEEIQVSFSFDINKPILVQIHSGPCRQSSLQDVEDAQPVE